MDVYSYTGEYHPSQSCGESFYCVTWAVLQGIKVSCGFLHVISATIQQIAVILQQETQNCKTKIYIASFQVEVI